MWDSVNFYEKSFLSIFIDQQTMQNIPVTFNSFSLFFHIVQSILNNFCCTWSIFLFSTSIQLVIVLLNWTSTYFLRKIEFNFWLFSIEFWMTDLMFLANRILRRLFYKNWFLQHSSLYLIDIKKSFNQNIIKLEHLVGNECVTKNNILTNSVLVLIVSTSI